MNYQPRSTNPYIMEKKLNECVGGGGFDPSVLEEIEAEISVLGSENATMAQDIIDIKGSLDSINDNLSGFKFYPTGTGIVGLISDDSPYKDANDKYVIWGTATANQLVADNPNTYKSVPSAEDTRGKVGADTACPFNSEVDGEIYIPTNVVPANQNIRATSSNRRYILGLYQGNNYYANQSLYDTVNNVWVNITNDILTKIADKFKLTQTFNQLSDISYAMKKDATGFYFTNVSSYSTKAMFIYTDSIS